ncbi:MAG: NAD(P)/FAD-dependent oxidoreductase [Oscillospiraceae bacterium]|nr:NAD(P)/FAD-dependent oxidoreductase [Oscillospiraceae bacterium]
MQKYDIIIIGGGITGCAIARELSKYRLKIAVCEAAADVAAGTTKANGGIIHAGDDPVPGTLKAFLNSKGCLMYPILSEKLGFRFRKKGSMVVGFDEHDHAVLKKLLERGRLNGAPNLELIQGERIFDLEPETNRKAKYALYTPHTGMVDPFEVAIAFCENAVDNGAQFYLSSPVTAIRRAEDGTFTVTTPKGELTGNYLVNCAGVHADDVARLAGADEFTIRARHGDLLVMDKNCGIQDVMTLYPVPKPETKGVVLMNTVSGNILVGSTAVMMDKDDVASYREGIDELLSGANRLIEKLNTRKVIRTFAGNRAVVVDNNNDFYIRPSKKVEGLFHVAGIQSPGIASSPAIAAYVAQMLKAYGVPMTEKEHFIDERRPPVDFSELSMEERDRLIRENPAYGRIVCRCECVTEGEIIDALHRNPQPTTVDAVKRRTRAGMGRCQGGFCQQKVLGIMAKELGRSPTQINLGRADSQIVYSKLKEGC